MDILDVVLNGNLDVGMDRTPDRIVDTSFFISDVPNHNSSTFVEEAQVNLSTSNN